MENLALPENLSRPARLALFALKLLKRKKGATYGELQLAMGSADVSSARSAVRELRESGLARVEFEAGQGSKGRIFLVSGDA